jgi:hypothetical protein
MNREMEKPLIAEGYAEFLQALKTRIQQAQVRAALSVNRELVVLYWHIGREILQKQQAQGWGAKVIERLAKDLRRSWPDMKGFSPRNLKYMRAFAEVYADEQFVQQVAAQIPWGHKFTWPGGIVHTQMCATRGKGKWRMEAERCFLLSPLRRFTPSPTRSLILDGGERMRWRKSCEDDHGLETSEVNLIHQLRGFEVEPNNVFGGSI